MSKSEYFGFIRTLRLDSSRIDKDLGELNNSFNHARLLDDMDCFTRPTSEEEFIYSLLISRFLPHRKYKPTKHWKRFIEEEEG